jgi:HNH endonuclease
MAIKVFHGARAQTFRVHVYDWTVGQKVYVGTRPTLEAARDLETAEKDARRRPEYKVEDRGYRTPCWIWLGDRQGQGYGRVNTPDGSTLAHRVYYERHVGPIPAGHSLDHLCRVRLCVNPEHVEPVTFIENMRRGSRSKLTWQTVREIRASTETTRALAERYGVARSTVQMVRNGVAWVEHTDGADLGMRRLSDADVSEIRRLVAEGVSQSDVARQYGITLNHAYRIVKGHARTRDTDHERWAA